MLHLHHPVPLLLGATALLVAYGRWRADLVALAALLAAVAGGLLPLDRAFAGFASPVLPTLALLAASGTAIRNSGVVETVAAGLRPLLRWGTTRVAAFGLLGALLSAGIGARPVLSWMTATALGGIRRDRDGSAPILLPISLLATLGGLLTAAGTLPNLLLLFLQPGRGFTLFSFAATGLPVFLAGLLTVLVAWRFIPQAQALADQPQSAQVESYTSELVVPPASPLVGQTVAQLELRSEGAITVKGIVREAFRRIEPRADWAIEPHDVLVLSCEPLVLQRLMERSGLSIVGSSGRVLDPDRVGVVEAVLTPASELVGRSPGGSALAAHGVSLLAIGRTGRQPSGRLRRTKLQPGDVLMLQGELATLPATLSSLGCLTLAERRLRLGRRRQLLAPLALLVLSLALAAAGVLPLTLGLLLSVLLLVLLRGLTLDELYLTVPWPSLVLIGALLPLTALLGETGAADTLAQVLHPAAALVRPVLLPLPVLLLALLAVPLLGGVLTLLVAVPLLSALAASLGQPPEPLLLAAALGASCEFVSRAGSSFALLPTGSLRLRSAWRLLLPLYLVVLATGTAAIAVLWPSP